VIPIVVVVAQALPVDGVNVYVVVSEEVVVVLSTAGDHVPVKPLLEVGERVIVLPLQNGPN
jgi:hypothetical protein